MGRLQPYIAVSSQAKITEVLAQLVHLPMDPLHRKALNSQSRVERQNLKLQFLIVIDIDSELPLSCRIWSTGEYMSKTFDFCP